MKTLMDIIIFIFNGIPFMAVVLTVVTFIVTVIVKIKKRTKKGLFPFLF